MNTRSNLLSILLITIVSAVAFAQKEVRPAALIDVGVARIDIAMAGAIVEDSPCRAAPAVRRRPVGARAVVGWLGARLRTS